MSSQEVEPDVESEQDEDSEVADAEERILKAAREAEPATLMELRRLVEPLGIDASVLEASLWSLINERTIELKPDRSISISF